MGLGCRKVGYECLPKNYFLKMKCISGDLPRASKTPQLLYLTSGGVTIYTREDFCYDSLPSLCPFAFSKEVQ